MSAHKRAIPLCTCTRKATYEVFNTYNSSYGYFCTRCSDRQVRRLKELEEEAQSQ